MKSLLLTLFFLLASANVNGQQYRLAKEANLPLILINADLDSIEQIERLAAIEFHKLLNQYRQENQKDTLEWNDLFWLSSRNHNLYLLFEEECLTHRQEKNKKNFSGEMPGDRLNYVKGNNIHYAWSGENCLYNFSGYGATIERIAKNIAKESIKQWKNSTGHNNNMLSSSHSLHGVAFTLSGSQVYGTDLFGRETSEYKNDDPKGEIPQEKPKYEITPTPSDVRITPSKAAKELINGLTERMQKENKEILTDKLLKTTAQKHANYMSANKTLTHLQSKENKNFYGTTAVKRHAKTKYGFWKLLKPKITNLTETIALLEIDEANYDHEKILNQLWEELEIFPKGYTQLGLSIKIRRNKDQLEIYAVLLLEE